MKYVPPKKYSVGLQVLLFRKFPHTQESPKNIYHKWVSSILPGALLYVMLIHEQEIS